MALVEWGDAAEPVLGADALSLLLETDPDDECRRTITVSAAGSPAGPTVGPPLRVALAPWAGRVGPARPGDGHRPGRRGAAADRRRRGRAVPRRWPGPRRAAGPRHRGGLRPVGVRAVRTWTVWPSTSGPGLFTGLRVGVATAKALGQALGAGVLGVSSLDVLAAGAVEAAPGDRSSRVVAVVDARRGEVFAAAYDFGSPDAGAADGPEPGGVRTDRPEASGPRRPGLAGATPWRPRGRCWWSGTGPCGTSSSSPPGRGSIWDSSTRWPHRRRPSLARLAGRRLAAGGGALGAGRRGAGLPPGRPTPGSTGRSAPPAHGDPPAGRGPVTEAPGGAPAAWW